MAIVEKGELCSIACEREWKHQFPNSAAGTSEVEEGSKEDVTVLERG